MDKGISLNVLDGIVNCQGRYKNNGLEEASNRWMLSGSELKVGARVCVSASESWAEARVVEKGYRDEGGRDSSKVKVFQSVTNEAKQ